jgi:hypothetical protein
MLRLNVSSEVNQQFADTYYVQTTPTFILFDAAGREQRRWVETAPTVAELSDECSMPSPPRSPEELAAQRP